MRHFLTIIAIFTCSYSFGQDTSIYHVNFSNIPLADALEQAADKTGYQFYYAPQWVDSVKIDTLALSGPLNEIIEALIGNTLLEYVIVDEKVILTYNTPIISTLPTASENEELPEVEYLFSREFNTATEQDNPRDKTYIIGEKSKMKAGAGSVVAGFIRSTDSNEPLAGASVEDISSNNSTVTDESGFYSLKLPNGKNQLVVRYAGMKQANRKLILFSDGKLDITMEPEVLMLNEFIVRADADKNIRDVKMGVNKIELDEMKNIPKVFGENDIVKVALALPGVQNVGEGASGLNIRGGKTDQNLLLLNNATIYNPFHFFGFFSSFNSDLLESTELYKSSMPANFGGRLAAVLDVKMKAGNKEKFSGSGGISPVTSHLSLEVPLIKSKTSMIAGGRSTYSDWILNSVNDEIISNSDPVFYDLGAGIDHIYNETNNINFNTYYSYDQFRLSTDSLYSYANFNASLNWKHHFSEKFSGKLSAAISTYEYNVDYDKIAASTFEYKFRIQDIYSQLSFVYTPSEAHSIQLGVDAKNYQIDPTYKRPKSDSSLVIPKQVDPKNGVEGAIFISDNISVNKRLSFYLGLRYSGFIALGPGTENIYNPGFPKSTNTLTDAVSYDENEEIKSYRGAEWRISSRYALNDKTSVKASYNRTRQYIHMLSNNISVSPVDTWTLSDSHIMPQVADQYALGLFKNFKRNTIEASLEIYYKDINNLLEYKTGADLVLNNYLEADVLQGEGKAYGAELLIKKNRGKLNGWIGYTYSRSLQRFTSPFDEEKINNGVYFPTNFDKPHSLIVITNYKLTRRYSFSFNLNYASGRPVTYPSANYEIGGVEVVHYGDRNSFRIPDYFRIDIGVNIEGNHRIKKLAHSFWSISVYNVLGRDNPYSVYFENDNGKVQGYQLSILAYPIPSISYKFRF